MIRTKRRITHATRRCTKCPIRPFVKQVCGGSPILRRTWLGWRTRRTPAHEVWRKRAHQRPGNDGQLAASLLHEPDGVGFLATEFDGTVRHFSRAARVSALFRL